jgi:hypothetical protein
MVRHPLSDRIRELESFAGDLAAVLPGAVVASGERPRVVTGVYDVVFVAGSTNMGAKAVAAMLPNDALLRQQHGSRLLLFRNVITAKFESILKPLAARLLQPEQAALVEHEPFLLHTLFHEMAHALAADPGQNAGARPSPNQRLRERYSAIEECRADLVALVFLQCLADRGIFGAELLAQAAVTMVAGSLRVLRFGGDNDYGKGAAMILSHLMSTGAIHQDGDRRIVVDVERTLADTRVLASRVQSVVNDGRYEDAGALLNELAHVPAGIAAVMPRLESLPIDVEFTFDPSLAG